MKSLPPEKWNFFACSSARYISQLNLSMRIIAPHLFAVPPAEPGGNVSIFFAPASIQPSGPLIVFVSGSSALLCFQGARNLRLPSLSSRSFERPEMFPIKTSLPCQLFSLPLRRRMSMCAPCSPIIDFNVVSSFRGSILATITLLVAFLSVAISSSESPMIWIWAMPVPLSPTLKVIFPNSLPSAFIVRFNFERAFACSFVVSAVPAGFFALTMGLSQVNLSSSSSYFTSATATSRTSPLLASIFVA
ncbi:hypothetical protein ES703_56586 [subsurface metagenome]